MKKCYFRERKVFFFEKKKQKTFLFLSFGWQMMSLLKTHSIPWPCLPLLLALVAAAPEDPAWHDPFLDAERMDTSRIIGGYVAPPGSFPAALQLAQTIPHLPAGFEVREGFSCGASVIAPRWALTAAHCLVGLTPEQVVLRGGSVALGSGGRRVSASRLVVHEHYNRNGSLNDIALIELTQPLDLPAVMLADTPLEASVQAPRRGAAVVVGWGNTRWVEDTQEQAVSAKLLQVQIDVLSPEVCARGYPSMPRDGSQFCAGVVDRCPAEGACPDSCQGDSGGPLFVTHTLGLLQAGVVSYGDRCGIRGRPGVYTSVAFHAGWIRRHVPEANFAGAAPAFRPVSSALAAAAGPPPLAAQPALRPAVTLSLPGGSVVHNGAALMVRLVSNVPGRLLLFNENAAGRGALVVPNRLSREQGTRREQVRQGVPVLLPDPLLDGYELDAAAPLGRQRLVAVVVPAETPGLDTLLAPFLAGEDIRDIHAWVTALAARLPAGRVALGEAGYEIVR